MVKSGQARRLVSHFSLKAVLTGMMIFMMAISFAHWPFMFILEQMTFWVFFLTLLQVSISLKCSYDTDICSKPSWLKAHHVLLEVITPMNIIATVVYWLVLSEKFNEKNKHDPFSLLHTATVHSVPLIANVLNLLVTDVVFKMSHVLILIPIAFAYSAWNCYVTLS